MLFLEILASKFSYSYSLLDGGSNYMLSGCTLLKLGLGHQPRTIMFKWIQEVTSYG